MSYTERRDRLADAALRRATHATREWVEQPRLIILQKLISIMTHNPPWLQGTKFDLSLPAGRALVMETLIHAWANPTFTTRGFRLDLSDSHSEGIKTRKVADKEPLRWKERE